MKTPLLVTSLISLTALLAPIPAQAGGEGKPAGEASQPKAKAKAKGDDALPPPIPLGKAATEALSARFKTAEHWLQKAVILLTLNEYWAPEGSAMLIQAFQDKDKRMAAFALEALVRSETGLLPKVVSAELLAELIDTQLDKKNQLFHQRLLEVLARIAPDAAAANKDRGDWESWWRKSKETWAPKPWQPKPAPASADKGGTVTAADRAFDLYQYGLDMVLCVDSTGSMQPTIDTVRTAIEQMVDLVDGISPKFRLGIVHYKDEGNLGKVSAKMIQSLTRGVKGARGKLSKLRAGGGNASLPEHVLDGVKVSLDGKMRWNKDANKVLVIIGDAPPLAVQVEEVVELIKKAHDDPAGLDTGGGPKTGPKEEVRPYITACIGVLLDIPKSMDDHKNDTIRKNVRNRRISMKQMEKDFARIAEVGGGTYQTITFVVEDPDAKPAKEDKRPKRKPSKQPAEVPLAIRNVVSHILVLSFGKRFAREMRDFARIYFEYKADKLFR